MRTLFHKAFALCLALAPLSACGTAGEEEPPAAARDHALGLPGNPSAVDDQGRKWVIGGYGVNVYSPSGVYRFTVGNSYVPGFRDGYRGAARLTCPTDIQLGNYGIMLVSEPCKCAVREITPDGTVATIGTVACGS